MVEIEDTNSFTALSQRINSNDIFFGRLISMIPADLYKPPEIDQVILNSKYYKVNILYFICLSK